MNQVLQNFDRGLLIKGGLIDLEFFWMAYVKRVRSVFKGGAGTLQDTMCK